MNYFDYIVKSIIIQQQSVTSHFLVTPKNQGTLPFLDEPAYMYTFFVTILLISCYNRLQILLVAYHVSCTACICRSHNGSREDSDEELPTP